MTGHDSRTKAYSYLRFSTPDQARGDSSRRQRKIAEVYAANNNLELDDTLAFHDLGRSAYRSSNSNEGMLGEFLRLVKANVIERGSFLLVENLDRISRDVPRKATRTLEDIVSEGITLVTLSDNRCYDLKILDEDPMAFMVMVMGFQRAHEESLVKGARIREAWKNKREKAKEGALLTNRVPAWLKIEEGEIKPIPERAKIIKWLFTQSKGGKGTHALAKELNERGEPTWGRSEYWHRSYISKILKNPAVIGTLIPHEIVTDPDTNSTKGTRRVPLEPILKYYPAVISNRLWQEVTAVPTTPLGRKGSSGPKTILAGLATCPICEGRMHRVNKGSRSRPSFVCGKAKNKAGCTYKSIRLDHLEPQLVSQILPIILKTPPAPEDSIEETISATQNTLEATQEARTMILDNLSIQRSPSLAHRLAETEREIENLSTSLRDMENKRDNSLGPVVNHRIEKALGLMKQKTLPVEALNSVLRSLFKKVIIDYKTGYVRFIWHSGGETEELYGWPQE